MTGLLDGDESPTPARPRLRNRLIILSILILTGGGAWFIFPELQKRLGLETTAAIYLATALAMVPSGLLIWLIARLDGWGKQVTTPGARWVMTEKKLASERRWRPWMVIYAIVVAMPYLADVALQSDGTRASPADWSLLTLVLFSWSLILPTAKTTALHDEGLRSERSEAIRLGYVVVITLGTVAVICANYWPDSVARCWPLIVILGILVPQVRLIMLDHRVTGEAGDAAQ